MKEIERHANPSNLVPTSDPTLFQSMIAVLTSSFGGKWFLSLVLIAVVILWPVAVFFEKIKLDPPHFVTDWLKVTIEGIIFYFVLEVVRHRSMSFTSRQLFHDSVRSLFLVPLRELAGSLAHLQKVLTTGTSSEVHHAVALVVSDWKLMRRMLERATSGLVPMAKSSEAWFEKQLIIFDIDHFQGLVSSLESMDESNPSPSNSKEIGTLIQKTESLQIAINEFANEGVVSSR